jgi:hypothetical protein
MLGDIEDEIEGEILTLGDTLGEIDREIDGLMLGEIDSEIDGLMLGEIDREIDGLMLGEIDREIDGEGDSPEVLPT